MTHSTLSAVNRLHASAPDHGDREQDQDHRLVVVSKSHEESDEQLVAAATVTLGQGAAREALRIPKINIHAFHHDADLARLLEGAARDRLMSGTRVTVHSGGVKAAVELYRDSPTPNLIVLECHVSGSAFLAELDTLAGVCDAGTRLMVIGRTNDVGFYRELVKRGVSEYVLAPIDSVALVSAISDIYKDESSSKLGQTYAFLGAKGGVGSSTIAHNVAWTLGRDFASDIILADMDLPFGTAALNLNTEANQGIAEAINDASRLDHVLLERLLTKCGDHVGLLAAPAALEVAYDLDLRTIEPLLEVAQSTVPFTILDLPHIWSPWSRGVLGRVDDVVIVATPDLASLRNTKNYLTILRQLRPHDPAPRIVLNQIGMPKRPEIKPSDFASALQLKLTASISFNPQLFGNAANKGQMIAEIKTKGDAVNAFAEISRTIAGQRDLKRRRAPVPSMKLFVRKMLG